MAKVKEALTAMLDTFTGPVEMPNWAYPFFEDCGACALVHKSCPLFDKFVDYARRIDVFSHYCVTLDERLAPALRDLAFVIGRYSHGDESPQEHLEDHLHGELDEQMAELCGWWR